MSTNINPNLFLNGFTKIKNQVQSLSNHLLLGAYAWMIALMSSCSAGGGNPIEISNNQAAKEIVMFCGNPGVGKSSLMNSILQQKEHPFKSGVSIGAGLTTESQSFIYEGIKYMDTPGLSDVNLREQAARQIEKALKEDNNYKIVFVITLEGGRLKPDDLTTINLVCDAVTTQFKYGIIINKVTKAVENRVNGEKDKWVPYLGILKKQPTSLVIINKDEEMEDQDNKILPAASPNRAKLLDFIASLPSNSIPAKAIEKIKENEYEEMKKGFEKMITNFTNQISDMAKEMKSIREANEKLAETNAELREDLAAEQNRCIVM